MGNPVGTLVVLETTNKKTEVLSKVCSPSEGPL
jgi:hypothetical protein